MTGNNRFKLMYSLVILSTILIFPTMASILEIEDETFSAVGVEKVIEIKLNITPDGLSGFIIPLYLEDETLAEIISVEFRPWAVLNLNSTLPSDDFYILAADMENRIHPPQDVVRIANVTIRADAPGTTHLRVGSYQIKDDNYDPITLTTIQGGLITIQDHIPPASVTNLHNTTYQQTSITWTWNDPSDTDFAKVMVYLDGVFTANVTKGIETYTAGSLTPDTSYEIGTRTVDTSDNVNATWVNQTAQTSPAADNTPPASVTNLHNTTYQQTSITWTWTDPTDADFAKVMIYLDGLFKANVTKGTETYTAGSLTPGTSYEIGTRTVDTSDNVNATWVNQTATTKPATGETGSLYIGSSPTGATILIDGVDVGKTTKVVYNVAGGTRNVTLTKEGYPAKTLWVIVEEGRLKMVYWKFIAP